MVRPRQSGNVISVMGEIVGCVRLKGYLCVLLQHSFYAVICTLHDMIEGQGICSALTSYLTDGIQKQVFLLLLSSRPC